MQFAVGLYTTGSDSNAFDPSSIIDLNVRAGGSVHIEDTNKQLVYQKCSRAEVDSKLYPVSENKIGKLNALYISWYCFDLSGVQLYGSWQTEWYKMLSVGFDIRENLCVNSPNDDQECRASAQTEAQLAKIQTVMLVNQERSDPKDYETGTRKEAVPFYDEIPSRAFRKQYEIQRGRMSSDDDPLHVLNLA